MTLRLFNKINSSFILNFGKIIKNTTNPLVSIRPFSENPTEKQDEKQQQQTQLNFSPMYNNVSQQHLSEAELLQNNMQKHHLQPALQPEFYQPPIDLKSGTYPSPLHQIQEPEMKYKKFEASKTYQSVTLPLKKPKLASPFPDPVKVMASDTVSDQEKAEQMQAEARLPKSSGDNKQNASMNFTQVRSFGTSAQLNKDKCPTMRKSKKSKSCTKLNSPNCPAPPSTVCEEEEPGPCKKKNAPYPAYSEFCHTILDEKPSECKMCPWKPEQHPTFKVPKKKYHTSLVRFCPKKWKKEELQRLTDKRNGWTGGKWQKARDFQKINSFLEKIVASRTDLSLQHSNIVDLYCMKKVRIKGVYKPRRLGDEAVCFKKPCKKPKSNICKKSKKKKAVKKKKTKKSECDRGSSNKKHKKSKKNKSKKKAASTAPESDGGSWITLNESATPIYKFPLAFNLKKPKDSSVPISKKKRKSRRLKNVTSKESIGGVAGRSGSKSGKTDSTNVQPSRGGKNKKKSLGLTVGLFAKSKKKSGKKKSGCNKVPFSGCTVKKQKKKQQQHGCPKPKKHKKVKDCPADDCGKKKTVSLMQIEYLCKEDKKCPRISTEVCKEEEEDDDPCKLKRKGVTKKCPTDLLELKRHKPKKPPKKSPPSEPRKKAPPKKKPPKKKPPPRPGYKTSGTFTPVTSVKSTPNESSI